MVILEFLLVSLVAGTVLGVGLRAFDIFMEKRKAKSKSE